MTVTSDLHLKKHIKALIKELASTKEILLQVRADADQKSVEVAKYETKLNAAEARARAVETKLSQQINTSVDKGQDSLTLEHLKKFHDTTEGKVPQDELPSGWFSDDEARWLYTMGRACSGPLIEQGPFAGRSTVAFASGIRDAILLDKQAPKVFISQDIFPLGPGFSQNEIASVGYPNYWKKDGSSRFELYVDDEGIGGTSAEEFADPEGSNRGAIFAGPGGLHAAMIGNLHKRNLDKYVSVVTGFSYPQLPYSCGFFDTSHALPEIVGRLPTWIETVQLAGGARQILSFHDFLGGNNADGQTGCKG